MLLYCIVSTKIFHNVFTALYFMPFVSGNPLSQTRIHLPVVPPRDDRCSPELHVAVCDSVEFGHQAAVFAPRQVIFLILIAALTIHMTIIWVNA